MKELTEFRKIYGNDENAINRHSQRVYCISESYYSQRKNFYLIDRVLDCSPQYFQFQKLKGDPIVENGGMCCGNVFAELNAKSWSEAERVLEMLDQYFVRK